MGNTLAISRSLLDQVVADATNSTIEVCGLLFGPTRHAGLVPASTVTQIQSSLRGAARWMPGEARHDEASKAVMSVQICRNVAADPTRNFEIDPAALTAAYREQRAGGPMIVGCFHSHPSGSATPSKRDAEAAAPDGWVWLIVAGGVVRAWRAVRDGAVHRRFDPVALIETPACA